MRPTMRPGLQILRRDMHTVQLGLEWPGVATIRETPALAAVLDAIDGFRDARGVLLAASASGAERRDCESALSALIDCGAVVDGRDAGPSGVDEGNWSAWWLLAGPGRDALDVVALRRSCRVRVDGDGAVAAEARRLLAEAEVGTTDDPGEATLTVLASDCEPARSRADAAMHSGLPHLWVYVRDLVGVVGPFVLPGRTACLRCADRSRTERDPAWPTLLDSGEARPLRVPACDRVLASLVAAWAVQDVATWASAIPPQTRDRVVELPQGGQVQTEVFAPHPLCGCGWPVWHDTMDG